MCPPVVGVVVVEPLDPPADLSELSPAFAQDLNDLQYNFRKLAGTEPG
jgi:hypothetical protein